MNQTIQELSAIAGEAKAEVQKLRGEFSPIPGRLAEIEHRLKAATDEQFMRTLIQKRAEVQESREVLPGMIRGAEQRRMRAEAAHVRALAQAASPDLPAAIAADEEAKAALEVATQTARLAAKRRGKLECEVGDLTARWQKLEAEADRL
jgi:hypothetical protein